MQLKVGVIVEGNANVDKKHLTGESLPISVDVGDKIESGSIILDSAILIRVTAKYQDSTISKILNLVSNVSSKKSKIFISVYFYLTIFG